MDSLISIIVPIYKVEKYLDKCVDSIVNQTYQNLEIILVDDGSPDSCPQMCDNWAKKDSRIKVIHKPNGGLSDARNAGMKIATGEYVAFVDSDDFLDKHYTEYLYDAIVVNNVKMSSCDFTYYYDGEVIHDEECCGKVVVSAAETAIEDILNNRNIRAVAWNKMFHKDLLIGEEFPVDKYHEDEFFSYRIIHKAKKIAYIESPLYYYRQREGSIMASFNERHLDALDAYIERIHLFEKHYPAICVRDKRVFCISCVQFLRTALKDDKCDKKAIKSRIIKQRRQIKVKFKEFITYDKKGMIYVLASRFFITPFCRMLNR